MVVVWHQPGPAVWFCAHRKSSLAYTNLLLLLLQLPARGNNKIHDDNRCSNGNTIIITIIITTTIVTIYLPLALGALELPAKFNIHSYSFGSSLFRGPANIMDHWRWVLCHLCIYMSVSALGHEEQLVRVKYGLTTTDTYEICPQLVVSTAAESFLIISREEPCATRPLTHSKLSLCDCMETGSSGRPERKREIERTEEGRTKQ